jgi:hypothetical protein
VNVDTTNVDGIQRAANLGLSASGLVDLVVSNNSVPVGLLFDMEQKGRSFLLLRDPIEYYYSTRGEHAFLDPSITLENYAQGNGIENNWVIRFIRG